MYVLDRLPEFDEKSRQYPIMGLIGESRMLRSFTWSCKVWNDQGEEGACVGFSWSHELAARPKVIMTDADYARRIYHRAQVLDEFPGEDYSGTSVLAGAKAVQEILNSKGKSVMAEYRWAFGVEDLAYAIGYHGPAVIGINWYDGMWQVDKNGFVRKTGNIVGGHAILVRGFKAVFKDKTQPKTFANLDTEKSYFLLRNSWGQDWGVNGDCKVTVADMDALLRDGGDACIPVLRG